MKIQWTILLGVLFAAMLGLIFWILEFQHISFVFWMLVLFAVLWYFVTVAVSLRPAAFRRRTTRVTSIPRETRAARVFSIRSTFINRQWKVSLLIAALLAVVGIILWTHGYDSLSHLFWFLVVLALLWGCAQISSFLRPGGRRILYGGDLDENRPISRSWGVRRSFLDQFLPGVTMKSGTYNKGDEEVWDGNEKLPPQSN